MGEMAYAPTPQTITITVSLSRGFTTQDTFVAKIVDLNEKIPPDPLATDINPGYTVPALPVNPQKLSASWACGAATGFRTGNGIPADAAVPVPRTAPEGTVNGWMKETGSTTIPVTPPPSAAP